MSVFRSLGLTVVVVMLAVPSVVLAAGRVALVIGNSAYTEASPLSNPVNDARDIAAALSRVGFDVETSLDVDRDGLSEALRQFTRRSIGAEMALVFYAGHGVEVNGSNYLVPVDARLQVDTDVRYEAVPLGDVVASTAGATLRIVLLDACRNNPLARLMQRMVSPRSLSPGSLGDPDEDLLAAGQILVSYAAAAGTTASDGTDRNSPYTTALLANLEEPGLEIGLLFRRVRMQVLQQTDGRQRPHEYHSLGNEWYFRDPAVAPLSYRDAVTNVLLRLATERQDLQAMTELGERYELGRDVPRDVREALHWYRRAAKDGDARGQEELGDMYRDGVGVPQDYEEALRWYQQAAAQNYPGVQNDLGNLYKTGLGVQQNYETAFDWYRKAVEQEDALGRYNLGTLYRDGLGVQQDYQEAHRLFRLAAAADDDPVASLRAQFALGDMHLNGLGMETPDPEEAVRLFRAVASEQAEAARDEEAAAQNKLGTLYRSGLGVEQDEQEAVSWFRQASEQG